jgi:hypothetical protein
MLTVLVLLAQTPFEIVQVKVFKPIAKPLTVAVGELGLLNVTPAPVHVPVPTVGKLALRATLSAQSVWFAPAFATVGKASLVIVTVLSEEAQLPLLTVHLNT